MRMLIVSSTSVVTNALASRLAILGKVKIAGWLQSVQLSQIAQATFAAFGCGGQRQFLLDKPNLKDLRPIGDFRIYDQIRYVPRVDIGEEVKRIKAFREMNN